MCVYATLRRSKSTASTSARTKRVRRSCERIGVTMCRTSSAPELTSGNIGVKSEKFSRLMRTTDASLRHRRRSRRRATAIPANPPPRITTRAGQRSRFTTCAFADVAARTLRAYARKKRPRAQTWNGGAVDHEPTGQPEPQPEHERFAIAPPPRKRTGGIGAAIAGLGALALKFKALLFAGKFIAGSWTFFVALWLYVVVFGWRLALVLVLVILVHELGHYAAYRAYGLPARLPVFVPFLGAFTAGARPASLEQSAHIALAGPLTGLVLAGACYALGVATGDRFWFACSDVSAFLNLFNMLPTPPFDGGHVIGA